MRSTVGLAASVLLVLSACSDVTAPNDPAGGIVETARVSVAVNVSSAPTITAVRLLVTAPDLPDTLRFSLSLTSGIAQGTATVPAGPQRTFILEALDASGLVWYRGSATADVVPGQNPPLTIVLQPVTPDGVVPIVGQIGSYTLEVSPTSIALRVGETRQVTATVRDPSGAPVAGAAIGWTSDDVRVASVEGQGLVVANGTGRIFIFAHHDDLKTAVEVVVSP